MSQSDQPQAVRSYLSELRSALVGVPREIAQEIENGVTEELAGLSAADAVARIEELGDPTFIAAEAKASSASDPVVAVGLQERPASVTDGVKPAIATTEAHWFIVVASLLVAFGGIVIPLLGWIAGIVMVWMSRTWRTWEKWVGTLMPLALAGLLAGGSLLVGESPLFGITGWHLAIISVFFTPFFAGMWLLWRGLRRRVGP